MGIPYSREINAAFDQVGPLVAAGFEVLQTIKRIVYLVVAIQILTVLLLMLVLVTLLALLVTMNPDMERERKTIVTPWMKWGACWFMSGCDNWRRLRVTGWTVLVVGGLAGVGWLLQTQGFYVYLGRRAAADGIWRKLGPVDTSEKADDPDKAKDDKTKDKA